MSRRLGDDPLNRAKKARAASASADPGNTSQSSIQSPSSSSYEDVFFQRRSYEDVAPTATLILAPSGEAAEISEISEIPEIRELATASAGLAPAAEATPEAPAVEPATEPTQVAPPPPVPSVPEVVEDVNVASTNPEPVASEQSAPAAPRSSENTGKKEEPPATPQKSGGFFKRLFGKFK